jgi:hypothetical protein
VKTAKRVILLYGISMVVGLYTTFVLTVLWNWFAVPAFHVGEISFWMMYGLTMLISLLRPTGNDIEAEHRHKVVAVMLDACVPVDKREEVIEELKGFEEEIWWKAGWQVFGQVMTNSLTLGIGFVVHLLAS